MSNTGPDNFIHITNPAGAITIDEKTGQIRYHDQVLTPEEARQVAKSWLDAADKAAALIDFRRFEAEDNKLWNDNAPVQQ